MGGLVHAAALAPLFTRVTVLESDAVSLSEPIHRAGVAQGQQLHALLKRGWNVFERFVPGFTDALLEAGASRGEFGPDVRWYMNGTWWSAQATGFHGLGATRPFLEHHLRTLVLQKPNVTLRTGARARSLVSARPGVVTGVELELLETHVTETLEADLVVDCTGRNSKAPAWLTALGFEPPPIQEIDVGITYVTQLVRLKHDPGFMTCYLAAAPPHQKRFGMVMGAQNGLSIFLVGSYLGERPPTTVEGMLEFARTLSQPHVAEAVSDAETVTAPVPYHFKSNHRRAYGTMGRFAEHFVVTGDAACSFNPIYGQGMTAAAMSAELLHDLIVAGAPLDGLAKRFQAKLDRVLDRPWMAALANDFQFPEVKGPRNATLSFAAAYSNQVLRGMHHSAVQKRFLPVLNMTAGPMAFFHPTLLASATLAALGIIRRDPTYPGPRDSTRKVLAA